MSSILRYRELERQAAEHMRGINQCYAQMKRLREQMISSGLGDPEGIYAVYGREAGNRAAEAVRISNLGKDRYHNSAT